MRVVTHVAVDDAGASGSWDTCGLSSDCCGFQRVHDVFWDRRIQRRREKYNHLHSLPTALKELSPDHGSPCGRPPRTGARGGGGYTEPHPERGDTPRLQKGESRDRLDGRLRPAHNLYTKFGFRKRGPFADYPEDPNSIFVTKGL